MFKSLKKQVKANLKHTKILRIYRWVMYERWQPAYKDIEEVLSEQIFDSDIYFIQIGANDGKHDDFLNQYISKHSSWKGVLVEPQQKAFAKLTSSYEKESNRQKLIFENTAISNKTGYIDVYRPKGSAQSPIASLNSDHIKKYDISNKGIEKERVKCTTFQQLLDKHNIKKYDILIIDTEGHDFEILKQVNFDICKPALIVFEYIHITVKEYRQALRLLKKQGYKTYKSTRDILAVNN